MVSVIAVDGSAPREVGARMVVTRHGAGGSIGGGRLEFLATAQARKILDHPPGSWRLQDYPLGPLLGQCCGGKVRLLVERLDPAEAGWLAQIEAGAVLVTELGEGRLARQVCAGGGADEAGQGGAVLATQARLVEPVGPAARPVLLFGAGHVGQAIVHAAASLPLAITWLDTRPDMAEAALTVSEEEAEMLALDAPGDAAVLVLTHDHGLDYRLTRSALMGRAAYVGLIGSATKRARFLSRLAKERVEAARLTCPIGLPEVAGKQPAVIAIAVLAQLLALGPRA